MASVHSEWMHQHGPDFNIRTNSRLGAFLRYSGCIGDFTLKLALQELVVLKSWQEERWINSLNQLEKIYRARERGEDEQNLLYIWHETLEQSRPNGFISFGHELLDAELLEVTVPEFMECVEGLPRDSLRYRYNLAKYFRNLNNKLIL